MVLRIVEQEEERTHTLRHVFHGKAFSLRIRSDKALAAEDLSVSLGFGNPEGKNASLAHFALDMLRVHVKSNVSANEVQISLTLFDIDEMPRNVPVEIRFAAYDCTVASRPIMIVKYQFKITSTLSSLWYKDEGGRDKSMNVSFAIVDADGEFVDVNKKPELKDLVAASTLVYGVTIKRKKDRIKSKKNNSTTESKPIFPRVVNRHDEVYTQMPGTVLKLDSRENGLCYFRIDEVTKNHQNQSFCLMIHVDDKLCSVRFCILFPFIVTLNNNNNNNSCRSMLHSD